MIKPALAFRQPTLPKSWHELPAGNQILAGIEHELDAWLAKFFGYHFLKIGALSSQINTDKSPIKHQVNIAVDPYPKGVVADIDDLPFLEHSVDVCLLCHALEFSLDPHHVIRETNRVLIPNGYMVISGYNPFSMAGLNKLLPYRRQRFPWNERFFSPNRVKDWLHLMGYEILTDQRFFIDHIQLEMQVNNNVENHNIEESESKNTKRAEADSPNVLVRYWQKLMNRYFTCFGSAYVIVAKKRRHPLTPIKPKWQLRPNFKPVNVSSMNSSNVGSKKQAN